MVGGNKERKKAPKAVGQKPVAGDARKKGTKKNKWRPEDFAILKSMLGEGKTVRDIALQHRDRGWSKSTVARRVAQLEKGSTACRKNGQGRKRTARTNEAVQRVVRHLAAASSGEKSLTNIVKKCGVSKWAARSILSEDLKMKSVRKVQSKRMSDKTRQRRLERATAIRDSLKSAAKKSLQLGKIWWSDESFFRLDTLPLNRNNDRVWISRSQKKADLPAAEIVRSAGGDMRGVMACLSINRELGAIAPQIIKPGVKINKEVYLESLQDHVFPHIESKYQDIESRKSWVWMQDGASSHTAGDVSSYLDKYLGKRRWIRDWPPSSPDLNPLDFGIWAILKADVSKQSPKSLPELKMCIMKAVQSLPPELIKNTIDQVPARLDALVESDGHAFEHKLGKK